MANQPQIQPLPGYVLLKPYTQDWGGMYMPQNHGEQEAVGIVLSIGAEAINDFGTRLSAPPGLSVGDAVIHSKIRELQYSDFKGTKLRFVPFPDLAGVIKK